MTRSQLRSPAAVAILMLPLVALAGCGNKAVEFNNTLAAIEKKAEAPTKALKAIFDDYWNTRRFDPAEAEKKYEAALAAIDQVIADARAVTAPDLKLAREFKEAFITFYTEQRALVAGEIRQALDALKDGSPDEKRREARLQELEKAMTAKANESTSKMQNVQQRYAAANDMRIEAGQ